MKWGKIKRTDKLGLTEWVCEHGVGHTDRAHLGNLVRLALVTQGEEAANNVEAAGVHGCDGCCSRPDFPGREYDNVTHPLTGAVLSSDSETPDD